MPKRMTASMRCTALLLLMLTFYQGLLAQNGQVTGRVFSEIDNKPLAAVSVLVKGQASGTSTNNEGYFSIAAHSGDSLVFSYVGFIGQTVIVDLSAPMSVLMSPLSTAMQDVVVVGYGTQRRKDLTGSLSSVNAKDLKSLPVPNIGEALQGRAAGVQILSSGAPGSNVTIRVRGTGTINNSDPPCWWWTEYRPICP